MEYEGISVALMERLDERFIPTVCAFANTDGGTVYLGVSGMWEVNGVRDPEQTGKDAISLIREKIIPDISGLVRYEVLDETENGGKAVMAVRIPRGASTPYYLKGSGMTPEGVFLRQDIYTVPASRAEILRLVEESSLGSWESTRCMDQDMTFDDLKKRLKAISLGVSVDELTMMRIMRSDGTFSNLGLLMSDRCPDLIKAALYRGKSKSFIDKKVQFGGSLFQQLDDAFGFINENDPDGKRFPAEAVKEALANACTHRDYSFSGNTLINVFSDRLEIISYGGLAEGMNKDDIMMGISVQRNPHLTGMFRRFSMADSHGTGIARISESYEGYTAKPLFDITDNVFRYTLPDISASPAPAPAPVAKIEPEFSMSLQEQKVMDIFRDKQYIVRSDVERTLSLSQTASIELIKKMSMKGLIKKIGSGKNTVYGKNR